MPWLASLREPGIHRLLRRLEFRCRRGREHRHAPGPAYRAKRAGVARAREGAEASAGAGALPDEDEVPYYRRPSVARCRPPRGGPGARAEQGHGRNRQGRVVGAVDARSGRPHYGQGSRAGVKERVRCFGGPAPAYPQAQRIYGALGNWPVHFLPAGRRACGARRWSCCACRRMRRGPTRWRRGGAS